MNDAPESPPSPSPVIPDRDPEPEPQLSEQQKESKAIVGARVKEVKERLSRLEGRFVPFTFPFFFPLKNKMVKYLILMC